MSLAVNTKLGKIAQNSQWCAVLISQRNKSSSLGNKGDRLELLKKGTGGRSSFNGVVATVFGNSGFLGRYVVNALGKCGTQMILPYRGDFYDVQRLKVCGDLGQVLFHPFQLKDEESVAKAMQYSNVVINMIGKDTETRHYNFKDVNVDGARMIARLARENGVEKLIHFSALNASEKPKGVIASGSKFYQTKWEGEQAVKQEFPDAIIFRPSDMYGHEDRFLRYYANKWRRTINWIPLWKRGVGVYKSPVYVSDVAQAVVKAVLERDNLGEIYQAVGPKQYELCDLVDYMFKVMRRGENIGYYRYDMRMDPWFLGRVWATEKFMKYPPLSFERLEREHTTDVIEFNLKKLTDLGIKLTEVEDRFPFELKYWRHMAYFDPDMMQFEKIQPPPSVAI